MKCEKTDCKWHGTSNNFNNNCRNHNHACIHKSGDRYEQKEKMIPTHYDIMTKWWLFAAQWQKVQKYDPFITSGNKYIIDDTPCSKIDFSDMESCDIPSETKVEEF